MKTVTPNRTGSIEDRKFEAGQPVILPDRLADHLVERGYATEDEAPTKKGKSK